MTLLARDQIPREQAYSLCRQDAEKGNAAAQSNLAGMYSKGLGVVRDHKAAFKWFKLAAEQGNPEGQCNLGMKYYQGEGTLKDYVRAHMWLNLAAKNGARGAEKLQNIVSRMMTQNQIDKARELAEQCKKNNYKGF